MYLTHLSLTHFRNYRRLELDFDGPITLLQGANAQGKTNLLEAIYFLATSKPVHALNEREVVDWQAGDEPIPYSRVAATVRADGREVELEILLTPREDTLNFKKQVRINGVNRRAIDLVGVLRAVLFLPEDVRLVDGTPSDRRRYLDIALCQMDRAYCRALSQYQKVLEQRNSLLRLVRDREGPLADGMVGAPRSAEEQLAFWDDQLVTLGSTVVAARYQLLRELEQAARAYHGELSGGNERLSLQYLPSFNPGHLSEHDFARLSDESFASVVAERPLPDLDNRTVAQHFRTKLRHRRTREIDAGATLYGPHRDDFRFLVNGRDLRLYGSRGQQRSAALALKLAEVAVMTQRTGSAPLLLLDDVMSELDAQRRAMLRSALEHVTQALLTTTDWDDFTPEFQAQAHRLVVRGGDVLDAELAGGSANGSAPGGPASAPGGPDGAPAARSGPKPSSRRGAPS